MPIHNYCLDLSLISHDVIFLFKQFLMQSQLQCDVVVLFFYLILVKQVSVFLTANLLHFFTFSTVLFYLIWPVLYHFMRTFHMHSAIPALLDQTSHKSSILLLGIGVPSGSVSDVLLLKISWIM